MIGPAALSHLRVSLIFPTSEPDAVWSSVIMPGLAAVPGLAEVGGPLVESAIAHFAQTRDVMREIPLAALRMLFPDASSGRLILVVRAYQWIPPEDPPPPAQWLGEILVYSDAIQIDALSGIFTGVLLASGALIPVATETRGTVHWHASADGRVILAQPATPRVDYPVSRAAP